jgi:hypothetical protein
LAHNVTKQDKFVLYFLTQEGSVMKIKILVILFAIVVAGYMVYCALAQYEFSEGKAAFENQEWTTAWEQFDRIGGFYRYAIPSRLDEALKLEEQSGLFLYADNRLEEGNYASALRAYTSLLFLYPGTKSAETVKDLLPKTYLDWGTNLRSESDTANAIG